MATVIDFSAGPPSAESIKRAGHTGVVLYISKPRETWMTGKYPTREYLDDLDREGIKFAFVYQFRKGGSIDTGDAGRGYDGGYADASEALHRLNELRCSGHPVFFAVDWNIGGPTSQPGGVDMREWNDRVVHYFKGAVAKLGKNRVGIYGNSRVIHWAMEDDVVAEVEPGRVLGWQTSSWSEGVVADDYAVLYQRTHNVPGPDGVQIDINDTFHENWGWTGIRPSTGFPQNAGGYQLTGEEFACDLVIDTPDSGWRDPYKTQASVFHTTENGDSTPPENVANWQKNPANQSSYNVLCGADATGARTVRGNPDNRRSWSAGEPGNSDATHFSNVGRAARSRAEWFNNPKQLEQNARWAADEHLRYGRPLVWLEPADLEAGKEGFTSHGNWFHGRGGPAYRSDPGDNFPHDWVLNRAQELINEGEEDMSADLNTVLTASDGTEHKAGELLVYTDGRVYKMTSETLPRIEERQTRIEEKLDKVLDHLGKEDQE